MKQPSMTQSGKTLSLLALCLVGPAVVCAYSDDRGYTFYPLDVPAELGAWTSAYDINNVGVVVGNFVTVEGNIDGFVFQNGAFTDVAIPGASPDNRGALNGVNDLGVAVGGFIDAETGIGHAL